MMRFFKQPVVILLLICLCAGIVFLLIQPNKKSVQQKIKPTPTPIPIDLYPKPPISPAATEQTTTFTLSFSPKDQLQSVQTYRVFPPKPYDVAATIAERLLKNPTVEDIAGVRFWKTDTATVTGQDFPSRVSYHVNELPVETGTGLSEAVAEKLAGDALRNSGSVPSGYTLAKSGVVRFSGTEVHPSEKGTSGGLTKIGFLYQLSGLPLVDTTGGGLFASVTLDATGTILELSAAVPPALVPADSVDVIPVGQAVLALTNNKGVLTSAQYDIISVGASLTHPDIKNATITSMALNYLWDKSAQTIRPIYTFEGFSNDDIAGGKINLLYFVSALP